MNRNLTNEEKIIHFLDLAEVFLIWSIALATLHLNFVNKCQMRRAADTLEKMCMNIPQRSKILQLIKNKNLICDVTTCFFVVAEISIYSKIYPIATVINILSPFSATAVTMGNFQKICLIAWTCRLIFKHMNTIIEVIL
jgi:hypothetical protein